jgi:hypothetical protein
VLLVPSSVIGDEVPCVGVDGQHSKSLRQKFK